MHIHKIRRGETLGKIAKKYGTSVVQIRRLNPEITNPNKVRIGQVIDIPAADTHKRILQRTESDFEPEPVSASIITQAKRFVNLYEIESNAKWDNPATAGLDSSGSALRSVLEDVGWKSGWPYCAAFCEAVWRLAYTELDAAPEILKDIGSRLNPNVMSSFANWRKAGSITKTPAPGAIFFMQKGRTKRGHAGIVIRVFDDQISTIEGNTSSDPRNADADREGDGVFKRTRALQFRHHKGLWLRGFLHPVPPH